MRDLLSKLDAIVSETALRDKDDLSAKRQALDDLESDPVAGKDPEISAAIDQRRSDLEREAKAKGFSESFQIGDAFGISFSEDHEIATEIVDILEDGIVIELDDTALDILANEGLVFLDGEIVREEKQKGLDGKACWKGYKRMGTKMKGGKRVDNCVKMGEDIDESGLQYYTGKKKYGKDGMAALAKAGREGASEEELGRIKDKYLKKEDTGIEEGFGNLEEKVKELLDRFEQNAMEIGAYGDPDIEGIASLISQGDYEGAADEVYGSYADQDGGEVPRLEPMIQDLQDEFEALGDIDSDTDPDEGGETDDNYALASAGFGSDEDYESIQIEKAPPGAKAERMVKHIKKGYADDGKLTDKEKGIAYATAWKQHNKDKNESQEERTHKGGTVIRTDKGLKHYAKYDDDKEDDDFDDNKINKSMIYKIEKSTKPDDDVDEAKYQGREVPLGKKMAGDVKKSKVYVRKPNGKIVKVNFGDKKMRIKKSNPARRKSFRARHNCKNPGPRWKARYWSCRSW